MSSDGKRNGWILLLAIAGGMALGAWLAVWVVARAASAPSGGDPAAELPAEANPRILPVSIPAPGPQRQAFLFIRPADPGLCRTLQGVPLASYWHGSEPITLCAVADTPADASPTSTVEFFLGRSS